MTREDLLKSKCQDRCAEFGDPSCHELDRREGAVWLPCSDCLAEIGEEPDAQLDPNAVVRPLFDDPEVI